MTNNKETYWWEESLNVCPICKKRFAPAPEHAWKIGKYDETYQHLSYLGNTECKLVCSYTCMRTWEKEQEVKLNKKRETQRSNELAYMRRKYHECFEKRNLDIKKMFDEGHSVEDISEKFKLTQQRIRQILKYFEED